MTDKQKSLHSVIVNAVVRRDEEVLISQRSLSEKHEPGKWTVPGGKIDLTDGDFWNIIEDTAKREVFEEVGIQVKDNVKLIANNTFIRTGGQHVIALIVLCDYASGKAKALEDTNNVAWIKIDEVPMYTFAPNVATYINNAFEKILEDKKKKLLQEAAENLSKAINL